MPEPVPIRLKEKYRHNQAMYLADFPGVAGKGARRKQVKGGNGRRPSTNPHPHKSDPRFFTQATPSTFNNLRAALARDLQVNTAV